MLSLRCFDEKHIDEDCSQLTGRHTNGLFFGCTFRNLVGLELIHCDLNSSRFTTSSVRDALGFSLTLDCHSFNNVEYSPLLMELLLYLLTTTKGNDEYRGKIADMLGPTKMEALRRVLRETE